MVSFVITKWGVWALLFHGRIHLQFVQEGDVVITMLPDDRVVQEAVTGKDGAMEGMPEGRGVIRLS